MEAFSLRLKARLDGGDTISSDSLFQASMMESWKEDLWWGVRTNGWYSGMEFWWREVGRGCFLKNEDRMME